MVTSVHRCYDDDISTVSMVADVRCTVSHDDIVASHECGLTSACTIAVTYNDI